MAGMISIDGPEFDRAYNMMADDIAKGIDNLEDGVKAIQRYLLIRSPMHAYLFAAISDKFEPDSEKLAVKVGYIIATDINLVDENDPD